MRYSDRLWRAIEAGEITQEQATEKLFEEAEFRADCARDDAILEQITRNQEMKDTTHEAKIRN